MREGSLSKVDQYAWTSDRVLRWRARLPEDPAFDNTEIVYDIAYSFYGALVETGNSYSLNHDYGFAERTGAGDIDEIVGHAAYRPGLACRRSLGAGLPRRASAPRPGFRRRDAARVGGCRTTGAAARGAGPGALAAGARGRAGRAGRPPAGDRVEPRPLRTAHAAGGPGSRLPPGEPASASGRGDRGSLGPRRRGRRGGGDHRAARRRRQARDARGQSEAASPQAQGRPERARRPRASPGGRLLLRRPQRDEHRRGEEPLQVEGASTRRC
jgi:hypothetical protein